MNGKPRVLFTANYGPNDPAGGEDLYNLMSTRWTRGHGAFSLDMFGHYFALYLIAENVSSPSTVLENPHWDEFDAELDHGYEYVCFQLKSVHTPKIARMMKRVREKCPDAKIVVGGYGVGTLDAPVPGDVDGDAVYIRDHADYLCREEGVRFMRRVLGDEPVEREITQYHVPMFSLGGFIGSNGVHLRIPMILVSLGCPNGCDFCNTSAFYKKKKIYVAEPEQVYRYIRNYQKRMRFREIIVMLWDEDFFLNPDYVRELGRLLRSHKSTWSVRYYTFGSIRSLSQYTAEELRDNGCQMVWIGVESFMCGGNGDDRYQKRQGAQAKEMFEGLRRHGIQPTGSLVLGLDFHTKENLKADADQFVALKPMFYQVSHVLPCPGTALYDRMIEEGRISQDYKWQDLHFWSDHVYQYQNCSRQDIQEAFQYIHDQLRDLNGPPTMQMMESVMDAYGLYKNDPDPFRQALARRDRLIAAGFYSFIHSIKTHHPSPAVRDRARMLEKRYQTEIGPAPMISRALGRVISRNIRKKSGAPATAPVSDPPPRWTYYHTYGDGVWVKKGRGAKRPVPYKDDSILAGVGLPAITSLIGKGKKGLKFLEGI